MGHFSCSCKLKPSCGVVLESTAHVIAVILGKDRGLDTPRGSRVGALMGRGRGMDIRTHQPPRGTLNVRAEFHFAISHKHQSHLLI